MKVRSAQGHPVRFVSERLLTLPGGFPVLLPHSYSALPIWRITCSDFMSSLIAEYDIVVASEVDQNGDYVSHAVSHHERRKRSTSEGGNDSLHLRFHGFGHDFQLDLKASDFLVAPGFTIQTLGKGRTKSVHTYPAEDFCFYQGVLRLHKNSSVALSTCGGLVSREQRTTDESCLSAHADMLSPPHTHRGAEQKGGEGT